MYSMARVKDDLYEDKIIARNLSYPAADEASTLGTDLLCLCETICDHGNVCPSRN